MKQRMTIIFDTETLVGYSSKSPSRSGIFFSTISLLKEFDKYCDIILYTDYKSWASIYHCKDFKKYKLIEPKSFIEKAISYGYYIRSRLDSYRKYWSINVLCKAITFSVLHLGKTLPNKQVKYSLLDINADVFVSFHSCPKPTLFPNIKKFTLLHDAIPMIYPNFFLNSMQYFFKTQIIDLLSPNNHYFANSQYTKNDFLRLFPNKLDASKIKVTHLGASDNFYCDFCLDKNEKIRTKYNMPKNKKYIFSLCTLDPRKNLLFVIENFLQIIEKENIQDMIFVLGGGHRDGFSSKIQKIATSYQNKIVHIGYVDDEDLSNLFSHSLCSIYLSLYEGFGLPVLESMQCGCPVITSNTTSIPEIAADAGILIDPEDASALQNAILQIYKNPSLREELRQKGLQRAREFSWQKCAKEMLEYMQEVLQTQQREKNESENNS